MMTRISTPSAAGSKLVPLALLVSLGLAVGVWLVPMPFLRVEEQTVEVVAPERSGGGDSSGVTVRVESHDWRAIETALTSARTPPPGAGDESRDGETDEGEDGAGDDETEEDTPREHLPPLPWRYVGYITQPNGRIAAVMDIDGGTRILYEGASIRDTIDPRQRDVVVRRITKESVTVTRAGARQSIDIEAEGASDAGGSNAEPNIQRLDDRR